MTDDDWILRINAIWFPIGLRMTVRCGLAEGDMDDALLMRDDGWHPTRAFATGIRNGVIAAGESYEWTRTFSQYYVTPMFLHVLRDGMCTVAYANAPSGHQEFVWEYRTTFDPRKPGTVRT